MRNHASPAHDSAESVDAADVVALALLLESNLFDEPFPDPGFSVSSIFEPIRMAPLSTEASNLLGHQIEGLSVADVRIAFGFMLDLICEGEEPAYSNVLALFPTVWARASEDQKMTAGVRYHTLNVHSDSIESARASRDRLFYVLAEVEGIGLIPDASRAPIYRRAAENLAAAKNRSYGWVHEVETARSLAQFGPHVPSIAFEEVYQEVLSIWCGNYWGRSRSHELLRPFIETLTIEQLRAIGRIEVDWEN
jgi:hypothetical protein